MQVSSDLSNKPSLTGDPPRKGRHLHCVCIHNEQQTTCAWSSWNQVAKLEPTDHHRRKRMIRGAARCDRRWCRPVPLPPASCIDARHSVPYSTLDIRASQWQDPRRGWQHVRAGLN